MKLEDWIAIVLLLGSGFCTGYVIGKNVKPKSITIAADSLAVLHQTIDRQEGRIEWQALIIANLIDSAKGFKTMKPGYSVYLKDDSSVYMFRDPDYGLLAIWLNYAHPVNAPIPPEWFEDDRKRPKYTKGVTP